MPITVTTKGDFRSTIDWLNRIVRGDYKSKFDEYGRMGVEALRAATPVDSGKTAESWEYSVKSSPGSTTIEWYNTNVNGHVNIAIIIQYGHGTGWGGYVPPNDYINPALKPVYEAIERDFAEVFTK